MSVDPEQRIQEIIQANDEKLAQYRQLAGELNEISAQASSPDNLIQVTVSHTGMLKQAYISPQIAQNPPRDLGATLVSLAQQAHAKAARQMAATVEPVFGADSESMRIIQGFVPEDTEPGTDQQAGESNQQSTRGHRDRRDDEDDSFGGSFLT